MAAHTILFDFTVDKQRTGDAKERQEVAKLLRHELEHIFPQLEMAFQMPMDDGYFAVLAENNETFVTVRIFPQGLVTINVEYYLEDGKEQLMSFDSSKQLENNIAKKLQVLSGQVLPAIKRGDVARYFPSSVYNQKFCKLEVEEDVFDNDSDDNYFEDYDPLDALNEFKAEGTEFKAEPIVKLEYDEDDDDIPLLIRKKSCIKMEKKRKKCNKKTQAKRKITKAKIESAENSFKTSDNEHDPTNQDSKKREKRKVKTSGKIHACGVCDKIFDFQFNLVDHVQELHPNENAYKCRNCSESFPSIKLLYRHRKLHRKSLKAHLCEFCSKSFDTKEHLRRHLRVHTNERPYACDMCGNAYKENKDLTLHKMSHTNERPCICPLCGKGFKENKTLKIHHDKVHGDSRTKMEERPYTCALCGKSYKENKDLLLHHQKIHLQPAFDFVHNQKFFTQKEDVIRKESEEDYLVDFDPFDEWQIVVKNEEMLEFRSCVEEEEDEAEVEEEEEREREETLNFEYCEKEEDEDDIPLIQWKRSCKKRKEKQTVCTIQTKRKKVQIENDSKACDTIEQMRNNIDDNASNKRKYKKASYIKHSCGLCDEIFDYQLQLVEHIENLHPKENAYKCRDCSDSFASLKTLYRHRKIHRKSFKAHSCEFCSKTFNDVDYLKRHLRVHTNERPYACDLCDKAYKYKEDLKLHKMSHTNERPCVCDLCGKGFKRNKALKLHHQKAHNNPVQLAREKVVKLQKLAQC